MTNQGKSHSRNKARSGRILLILLLIFTIPLLVALSLFKGQYVFGGLLNHGELIKPPFSITLLPLRNERGELLKNQETHAKKNIPNRLRTNGKWMLVYFNPGLCEASCREGLYNLRQILAATGKNRERVERALLTYPNHQANSAAIQLILSERFPGTRHLTVKEQPFTDVIRKHVPEEYALESGTIYLVDPLGNVMMTFKPGTKREAIFKDLQRLLKVSQIG